MKNNDILKKLTLLYGAEKGEDTFKKLQAIIVKEKKHIAASSHAQPVNQNDIVLISYPDSFVERDTPSLQTLHKFLHTQVKEHINTIHILPFNPASSDHGFSVVDYYDVEKNFGDWSDITAIGKDYRLMADLVLNHISAESIWFKKFLNGDTEYQDYFISFAPEEITPELEADLKKVFRPRSTPLLTPFKTVGGERLVWTTISVDNFTDQVDLNYKNPTVLLEMLRVFLFLIQRGVRVFRLDAITFIWKELGTNCVHLPQGHAILEIFRAVMEEVCPSALIVTETNVPHKDNISYFGNGYDEAHMVYNFALPPLMLHAMYTGNASFLTDWAKTLKPPSEETTLLNFLACHDGIGIMGARDVLPDEEIEKLFEVIIEHGTKMSYKSLPNGQVAVYEMCATWWSAINKDIVPFEEGLQKFITSHALCFALAGVPAVYYLSLFGRISDIEAWKKTNHNRDVLRSNLEYNWLESKLSNKDSKESKVFAAMKSLIKERTSHSAFHPNASQEILSLDERIFAILRSSPEEKLLALHNVTNEIVKITYGNKEYMVQPYGFLWETLTN